MWCHRNQMRLLVYVVAMAIYIHFCVWLITGEGRDKMKSKIVTINGRQYLVQLEGPHVPMTAVYPSTVAHTFGCWGPLGRLLARLPRTFVASCGHYEHLSRTDLDIEHVV